MTIASDRSAHRDTSASGMDPLPALLRARLSEDGVSWGVFLALLIGLAWVPLPFGSNRLLPWGINAVLFGSLLVAYEVALLALGRRHAVGIKVLLPAGIAFALVVVWSLVQLSPSAPLGLQHPIYQMAADALGVDVPGSLSVDRDATSLALLRLLTGASVLWLSLQLCRNPERAHMLLQAIGVIGAGYAVFGLVDLALGGSMLGFEPTFGGHFVRSTFVNKNTFATFAGLALVANVGLLLRVFRQSMQRVGSGFANRLVALIETSARIAPFRLGATVVLLVALLLTGSRAGIISSLLGLFALLVLTWHAERKRGSRPIETLVFVTLLAAACYLFFGDIFVGRITTGGFFDGERKAVFSITLQSILDAPFTGFGDGTFEAVFPMYRDQSISTFEVWDKAHDTYLEIVQGLGLIGGALLLFALGFLVVRCAIGFVERRRETTPCVVALGATALVATHSLVDFSLQIEAVTLVYLALLGAGVAQSISSRRSTLD